MLKKISVTELRIGMHLHRLEGAWIDHPFWRTRFTLSDEADLQALRASGVSEAWIDTALGLDVVAAAPTAAAPTEPAPGPVMAAEAGTAVPAKTSFDDELRRAAVLCRDTRQAVVSMFAETRMGRAIDARQCLPMVQEIADSVGRHPGALVSLARLKTSDDYTYMHSVAVCALMVALGRTLRLDDAACREAGLAGLLHDMGKAFMPLEILNKPGKLTDAEFAVMRSHPERGHEALLASQGVTEGALDVCLHHHEKVDGSGYPHRLAGAQITLLARMGAVCDVYDAVTSNRPYKDGWDPAHAIASMAGWQGHFDPPVFAAFVQSLGIYPTGSLVRLASGKLAVVVEQNAAAITTPVVKVFYSTKSKLPLPMQRLDLATSSERIVGRESREGWNAAQIEALWAADVSPK
jgi:HD-GYP domain-containing protein (c-di-GMP phosphodiesterase class II)